MVTLSALASYNQAIAQSLQYTDRQITGVIITGVVITGVVIRGTLI